MDNYTWWFLRFKGCTRGLFKIPDDVYLALAFFLLLGSIILLTKKGLRKGIRYSALLLMLEYVVVIFGATVFCRIPYAERKIYLLPLWSYRAIYNGQAALLMENAMNVVLFIPIGVLLGVAFRNINCAKVVLVSSCISVLIETMQFALKRGLAEFDDVMHNVLGSMIGYGFYSLVKIVYDWTSKKRVAVL